jgi:glutaminyl-peptide cyclotransferase
MRNRNSFQEWKRNRFNIHLLWVLSLIAFVTLAACGDDNAAKANKLNEVEVEPDLPIPDFSADSAYAFIEKQLSFGPRVPNTGGHLACADWMVKKFEAYGAKVKRQTAVVNAFDGTPLNMQNIIASYNPEKNRRILLSAHWDSRPFADQDSVRQNEPIPGANDGGSGVGVLLEIARQLGQMAPRVGVDIILWDAEDYGKTEVAGSYCLGSQYWVENKHKANYSAMYGINLDMVGAHNARFTREGHSMGIRTQRRGKRSGGRPACMDMTIIFRSNEPKRL